MISDRSGYHYTDEATLARIKINGDILPLRSQHQTFRSEDVVFLNEALKEREAAGGGIPDAEAFPVPRLQSGLVAKEIIGGTSGSWYAEGAISTTSMILVLDESYNSSGTDRASDFSSAASNLGEAQTAALATRDAAYQAAYQAYSSAVRAANTAYQTAAAEAEEEYVQAKADEEDRHTEAVEAETDDSESDIESLQAAIETIKNNKGLSSREKRRLIKEKEREIEERRLEHQKTLYDEGFTHSENLLTIERTRLDALAEAAAARDGAVEDAADLRDQAIKSADDAYKAALSGPGGTLRGMVAAVLGSPASYNGSTVFAASGARTSNGVDYKTPGEEAWDENLATGKVDAEHSASYKIGHKWDVKLHWGLYLWSLYSDFERMRVLRAGASRVPGQVWASEQHYGKVSGWDDTSPWFKEWPTSLLTSPGNVGIRSEPRYYHRCPSGSKLRVIIPVRDRVFASLQTGAQAAVELEYHVAGHVHDADHHTEKTFRKVVSATVGRLAPGYHADIDAVDDRYQAAVDQNEQKRKSDTEKRKAEYDESVASADAAYEASIQSIDDNLKELIESRREEAADQIAQISKEANSRARKSKNPGSVAQQAEEQIQAVRVSMNNAISDARSQANRDKRTLDRSHTDELAQLKAEYSADIAEIDAVCEAANQVASQERSSSKIQITNRYATAYNDRLSEYNRDKSDTEYDAWEAAQSTQDSDAAASILDAMVSAVDALTSAAVSSLNSMEYPTEYRLYAEVSISEVFGLGVDLSSEYGVLDVSAIAVRFKPNLRTLTGASFARFAEYYEDEDDPD